MPYGAGKYGREVAEIQRQFNADAVLLMVIGGVRGESFSVAAPVEMLKQLPEMLRYVADQIEADMRKVKS